MQLKTSSFKTVITKNLTRFWPLWALATFTCLLVPIAVLVDGNRADSVTGASYFLDAAQSALPVYCLIMSCFTAMVVWNYLYTPKSVGLMHSLPITRKNLFFASYLSGFIMTIIPGVAAGLLLTLFEILMGCFSFIPFLTAGVMLILESAFFFSLATFIAHITSNILALPVLYYILNFLAVIIEYVVGLYAQRLCFGLVGNEDMNTAFLSPTVMYYETVNYVSNTYVDGKRVSAYSPKLQYIEGWSTLLIYALVGVALLFAAMFLYEKRKSETAGEVVSAKLLRPVALGCFTACAALTGGLVLFYIFDGESLNNPVPLLSLCMMVATFIGFFLGHMIIKRTVRVFNKKTFLGYAVCAVLCVFFIAVLRCDAFGRERVIPDTGKVKAVYLSSSGSSASLNSDNAVDIDIVRDLHKQIIDSKKDILESKHSWLSSDDYFDDNYVESYSHYVYIVYELKNGKRIERRYQVWGRKNENKAVDAVVDTLQGIMNDPHISLKTFRYGEDVVIPSAQIAGESFDGDDAKELYDALIEDIKEGNYKAWYIPEKTLYGYIDIASRDEDSDRYETSYYYDSRVGRVYNSYDFRVNKQMKHVMDFIDSHGIKISADEWYMYMR